MAPDGFEGKLSRCEGVAEEQTDTKHDQISCCQCLTVFVRLEQLGDQGVFCLSLQGGWIDVHGFA